jgi:hypothetical protein
MNIKMSLVAAAVALAMGAEAQAFGPTIAPDVTIYMGGGSAQGGAFLAFAEKMMTAGFDVYTDSACGTQGANYRAVFGTGAATLPASLAGKKIFVEYANNGGTFKNGIDGVVRADAIDFQTFLSNSTACPGGSATTFTVTNANTKANFVPLIGLSDEEITLFTGVNVPAGSAAITPAELGNISQQPIYENVFGIAEDTLLAAQKTNFTTAEITAITNGSLTDWSSIIGDNGSPMPAGPITIIDRSAGSGSKAAFNEYFLHNPGVAGAGGILPPLDVNGAVGSCGAPATSGSGSYNNSTGGDCPQSSNGNVKTALNNANTAGVRAVGILGLEFQPAATDHYTFAKLNGVAVNGVTAKTCGNSVANAFEPANVVSGAYDLFFTNSLNVRTKSIKGAPFLGDGSVFSAFITAFTTVATDPVTEVSVPGVLLDPNVVGGPSGAPYDDCITKGTHNGNSTQALQLLF